MTNSGSDDDLHKRGHGSYVPPHKRGGQQQQQHHGPKNDHHAAGRFQKHDSAMSGSQQSGYNTNNNNHRGGKHHHHHPHHNNNNRNNRSNNNSRNSSPNSRGKQQHHHHHQGGHQNHHHHNNQHHQHHHYHHDAQDMQRQQQQFQLMKDSLTKICCINLERRADRWKSFQQHLHQSLGRKLGHAFLKQVERINAVDGIPSTAAASGEDESGDGTPFHLPDLVKVDWDASINAQWDRHIEPPMTKTMSDGEVGCALSHIQLWKELVELANRNTTAKEEEEAATSGDDDIAIVNSAELKQKLTNMLILEDDALFYSPKMAHVVMEKGGHITTHMPGEYSPPRHHGNAEEEAEVPPPNHDFFTAFQLTWNQLPEDWDIWYLGFSDRGERIPLQEDQAFHMPKPRHHHAHKNVLSGKQPTMTVELFQPTYGFHTHAYVVTAKAAAVLLQHLPVQGPLDVWLADNQWFGLKVYCSVIANEGWHGTGAWLVTQNRKQLTPHKNSSNKNNNSNNKNNQHKQNAGKNESDIGQSGRRHPQPQE